jgi:hypothetical protein
MSDAEFGLAAPLHDLSASNCLSAWLNYRLWRPLPLTGLLWHRTIKGTERGLAEV